MRKGSTRDNLLMDDSVEVVQRLDENVLYRDGWGESKGMLGIEPGTTSNISFDRWDGPVIHK